MYCHVCEIHFPNRTSKKTQEIHQQICQFRKNTKETEEEVCSSELKDMVIQLILRTEHQEKRIIQLERAVKKRIVQVNRLETLPVPSQSYSMWKNTWPLNMKIHFYYFLENPLKDTLYKMIQDIQKEITNPVHVPFQCLEAEITKPIFYYYHHQKWHKNSAEIFLQDLIDKLLEWLGEWSDQHEGEHKGEDDTDAPSVAHLPQPLYLHLSEKIQNQGKEFPKEWKKYVFEQFCREEV
jgi:hypothetical protein